MRSRKKIRNVRRDNAKFRRSAGKTKKMNVTPPIFRGGIRL